VISIYEIWLGLWSDDCWVHGAVNVLRKKNECFFLIILLKQQLTSNYSWKWACTSKLQSMMPGGNSTLFNTMSSNFSWRQVKIWLVVSYVQQMLESMQWHQPGWWKRDFLELWQAVAGLTQWPNWKDTTIEGCHNRERSQQHGRVPLCSPGTHWRKCHQILRNMNYGKLHCWEGKLWPLLPDVALEELPHPLTLQGQEFVSKLTEWGRIAFMACWNSPATKDVSVHDRDKFISVLQNCDQYSARLSNSYIVQLQHISK